MTGNPKAWMVHYRIWEFSLQEENTLVFNNIFTHHIWIHEWNCKLTLFVIPSGLDDARNTAQLAARMMRDGCVMKVTRSLTRVSGRHPVVPPSSWPLTCLAVQAEHPGRIILNVWIFLMWINLVLQQHPEHWLLFFCLHLKLWNSGH